MTAAGFDGVERRGLMFVLSSPSGAGKTTLSRLLLEREPGLKMSVSATTRPMRPGEVEGRDYFFVDKPKFETMVKQGELLEWATVFDNLYGTPRAPVEAALSAGQDVLFDIDWQGTQQLHQKASVDVVRVFILPPSAADLEKRLHTRAQDSDEVIRGRMSRATHELSHWAEYDYIVVNQSVDDAFAEVQSILKAERLKRERRTGLTEFVRNLQRPARKIAVTAASVSAARCGRAGPACRSPAAPARLAGADARPAGAACTWFRDAPSELPRARAETSAARDASAALDAPVALRVSVALHVPALLHVSAARYVSAALNALAAPNASLCS